MRTLQKPNPPLQPYRKGYPSTQTLTADKLFNCTIDSQVKLPRGLASDVYRHTGILSSVAKLSHVDL